MAPRAVPQPSPQAFPEYGGMSPDEARAFRSDVSTIATALQDISSFTRAAKKWTPWIITAIGVAYPAVAHFIAQLPPLPQ